MHWGARKTQMNRPTNFLAIVQVGGLKNPKQKKTENKNSQGCTF